MRAVLFEAPGRVAWSVRISWVSAAVGGLGRAWVERHFTAAERAYCDPHRRTWAQHYAARLAAKCAARHLLGPVDWLEVEVVRDALGAPSLRLGDAAVGRIGARSLLVSLSHDQDRAVALVALDAEEEACATD